jgi:hypothetical protein
MRNSPDQNGYQSGDGTSRVEYPSINTHVTPEGSLEILSHLEVNALLDSTATGLYALYRRCSLAVLNCGNFTDNAREVFETFRDFEITLVQRDRGIKLELKNAPASAFVDGQMITGIRELLFAVLRDIVYVDNEVKAGRFDLDDTEHITSAIFHILRNAQVLQAQREPNIVVCWGGHAISREEYDYSKLVGYELGLRYMDVCTGCGPGAMKGPMKGATIGHAKQREKKGRYIGITEPGIIAAESPNPIVNELLIMPDMEKRLEAFVRFGHGIVVFPGGVGTAEEILYLLGVLLHPNNAGRPFPLIFTGPAGSEPYFREIDTFIGLTLGAEAQGLYRIIIDDPAQVAREMVAGVKVVREYRIETKDAFYFNWLLHIEKDLQQPFYPTHEAMRALKLHRDIETHQLAAELRRAFSGVVAGNVKEAGIRAVEEHGPFELRGDHVLIDAMDSLLRAFAEQNRMKLRQETYQPCYRLVG